MTHPHFPICHSLKPEPATDSTSLSQPPAAWREGGKTVKNWDLQNGTSVFPNSEIRFALVRHNKFAVQGECVVRVDAKYKPREEAVHVVIRYSRTQPYSLISNPPNSESLWWIEQDWAYEDIAREIIQRLGHDAGIHVRSDAPDANLSQTVRLGTPEWRYIYRTCSWEVAPCYTGTLTVKAISESEVVGAPNSLSASSSTVRDGNFNRDLLIVPKTGGVTDEMGLSNKVGLKHQPWKVAERATAGDDHNLASKDADRAIEVKAFMTVDMNPQKDVQDENEKTPEDKIKGEKPTKKNKRKLAKKGKSHSSPVLLAAVPAESQTFGKQSNGTQPSIDVKDHYDANLGHGKGNMGDHDPIGEDKKIANGGEDLLRTGGEKAA